MDVEGEDEKDAWDGWEVDSDSDESSSESEGWVDVSSDGEDLVLSDSDDEGGTKKEDEKEKDLEEQKLDLTNVGTTKVSGLYAWFE